MPYQEPYQVGLKLLSHDTGGIKEFQKREKRTYHRKVCHAHRAIMSCFASGATSLSELMPTEITQSSNRTRWQRQLRSLRRDLFSTNKLFAFKHLITLTGCISEFTVTLIANEAMNPPPENRDLENRCSTAGLSLYENVV